MKQNINKYIKLHRELGWLILECKYLYYSDKADSNQISDIKYDIVEDRYKKLSKALNLPSSACDKVGFDSESPSGKLVKSSKLPMISKYKDKI